MVSSTPAAAQVQPVAAADQEFLDTLQERTFRFFWETANPNNGLVPDRWPGRSPSSVAAVGFGLTAYCVGVERGYIPRGQAIERVHTTLRFLWKSPQNDNAQKTSGYRGFFYHFLDMQSGLRSWNCELSSIDTALLMAGWKRSNEYACMTERNDMTDLRITRAEVGEFDFLKLIRSTSATSRWWSILSRPGFEYSDYPAWLKSMGRNRFCGALLDE